MPTHVRIFLSSPGDVEDERTIAIEEIQHLPYDPFVRGRATVEVVAWDTPGGGSPMPWGATPQASINTYLPLPSACDIVVAVLWARLGTPPPFPQFQTEAGQPYGSGTVWELEDAFQGAADGGRPTILIYRRTTPVEIDPTAPDHDERSAQKQKVDQLFDGFRDAASGSVLHGFKPYESPEQFRTELVADLRALIKERIEADERAAQRSRRTGNLPAPPTSFVGRGRELEELAAQLHSDVMVTLLGTSGTGKTRLAVEAARTLSSGFDGGAWFVDLSSVTDSAAVADVVASVLGVRGDDRTIGDAIVEFLADRLTLLVLDNCEHVIEGVATLVAAVLAAPGLRILATSQVPVGVAGEFVYRLETLPGADPGGALDQIELAPAVQLFADRARAARNTFALDERNAGDVARICQALDGLPLAIELAAARSAALTPKQLLGRLDVALNSAVPTARGADRRHSTLDAALQWSYELLSGPEGGLLGRLSVFAEGCTLEAAESVCPATDLAADAVWGSLTSLVEKSLVLFEAEREPPRYRLLRTVRTFAAERLADLGDAARVADLHCTWFVELAERRAPDLTGPDQQDAEDELQPEMDNLRAAFDHAMASPTADTALRLANAGWRFLEDRGRWRDWREWFDRALAHPGGAEKGRLAWALVYGALVAERIGEVDQCQSRLRQGLSLFAELGDERGTAAALSLLGSTYMERGDTEQALVPMQEALAIRQRIDDRRGIAVSLSNLSKLRYEEGDFSQARDLGTQALGVFREVDDTGGIARQLADVAEISLILGDVDQAGEFAAAGADLAGKIGNQQLHAWSTRILGCVAAARGERALALRLLEDSVRVLRDLGAERLLLGALADLAVLAVGVDNTRAARLLAGVREVRAQRRLPADTEETNRVARAEEQLGAQGDHPSVLDLREGGPLSMDRLIDLALGPSTN